MTTARDGSGEDDSKLSADLRWRGRLDHRESGPVKPALVRRVVIALVLVAGLYLRARSMGRELWIDEMGTVWSAGGATIADSVRRTGAIQGQSPFYYLVLRATIALLGDSELVIRLPTVVVGALAPLVAYLGASRAFGRRAGAAALVLVAFHPELVAHARQA